MHILRFVLSFQEILMHSDTAIFLLKAEDMVSTSHLQTANGITYTEICERTLNQEVLWWAMMR